MIHFPPGSFGPDVREQDKVAWFMEAWQQQPVSPPGIVISIDKDRASKVWATFLISWYILIAIYPTVPFP